MKRAGLAILFRPDGPRHGEFKEESEIQDQRRQGGLTQEG